MKSAFFDTTIGPCHPSSIRDVSLPVGDNILCKAGSFAGFAVAPLEIIWQVRDIAWGIRKNKMEPIFLHSEKQKRGHPQQQQQIILIIIRSIIILY